MLQAMISSGFWFTAYPFAFGLLIGMTIGVLICIAIFKIAKRRRREW